MTDGKIHSHVFASIPSNFGPFMGEGQRLKGKKQTKQQANILSSSEEIGAAIAASFF